MCRHLDLMIEVFGEDHGCRMFRKVAPWYAKRFGPANEFNKRVVLVSTRAEFLEVLDDYRRWREQFLDRTANSSPASARRRWSPRSCKTPAQLPQDTSRPKGPVEVW